MHYENDSLGICIQLNKGKTTRISPDGFKEDISDEDQLDRILSRSDKDRVYTPRGVVFGKQVIVQDLKFHNPYIFIIVKIVPVDVADKIKNHNDIEWTKWINNLNTEIPL